jgi:hypothetical protein
VGTDSSNDLGTQPVIILVRSNGNVHVIFSDQTNICESIYTTSWSIDNNIFTPGSNITYTTGMAFYDYHHDTIQLLFTEYNTNSGYDYRTMHARKVTSGSWSSATGIDSSDYFGAAMDKRGDLHVVSRFVDYDGGTPYTQRLEYYKYDRVNNTWSTSTTLSSEYNASVMYGMRILVSAGWDDVITVMYYQTTTNQATNNWYVGSKVPGHGWEMGRLRGTLNDGEYPSSSDTYFTTLCLAQPFVED